MQFPMVRSNPYAPPPGYRSPDGHPIRVRLAYGGDAWLVISYADARTVLADTTFSSDPTLPGYPNFPLAPKRRVAGHFLSMDPPEHTRLRRLVASEFTNAGLRPFQAAMRSYGVDLAAGLRRTAEDPAAPEDPDLIADFAVPLHGRVVADLLGVPESDRDFFQACARDLQLHDASAARRGAASGRMNRYLTDLIRSKRAAGTDLLSRLAAAGADGVLGSDEAVGMASLILVAGLETTVGLMGLTVLALLCNEPQATIVREDPRRWAAPAVREALRYWTVVQHGVARVATRDVVLSGRLIRAGEAVVVHLPTANRDPDAYPEPDSFDVTREAPAHLAFGYGTHRCLGGTLAQLEVSTALEVLFTDLPGIQLSEPGATSFLHHMLVFGVRELRLRIPGYGQV